MTNEIAGTKLVMAATIVADIKLRVSANKFWPNDPLRSKLIYVKNKNNLWERKFNNIIENFQYHEYENIV